MHLGVEDVLQESENTFYTLKYLVSQLGKWTPMVHELVSDVQLALSTLKSVDQVITSITDIAVPVIDG